MLRFTHVLPRQLTRTALSKNVGIRRFSDSISLTDGVHSISKAMQAAGVSRGYVVTDDNGLPVASHPVLQPIASFLASDKIDYDQHEAIFFGVSPSTGDLMSAFLWKTKRGQGCGGIRLRTYNDVEEYIRDGLRLAIGMGRKSSLAGLYWGGGKGIIPSDSNTQNPKRRALLEDYGDFLSSLRGCYVAAEDVGITVDDVDVVFSKTRFTTCISPRLGGSGNPSVPTALGVKVAMDSALNIVSQTTLEGKTVAIQGLGNVGGALVGYLLEAGVSKIIGSDISEAKISQLLIKHAAHKDRLFLRVETSDTPLESSIISEECDIFSPCGFGGILHETSVPHIKAKIICGAANNQLLDSRLDYGMHKQGIVYVPDFVCNRMGIVNCANEQYGSVGAMGSTKDPIVSRHLNKEWSHSVYQVTEKVICMAKDRNIPTDEAARELADVYAEEEHPIWGHRSKDIIQSLRDDGWAK